MTEVDRNMIIKLAYYFNGQAITNAGTRDADDVEFNRGPELARANFYGSLLLGFKMLQNEDAVVGFTQFLNEKFDFSKDVEELQGAQAAVSPPVTETKIDIPNAFKELDLEL